MKAKKIKGCPICQEPDCEFRGEDYIEIKEGLDFIIVPPPPDCPLPDWPSVSMEDIKAMLDAVAEYGASPIYIMEWLRSKGIEVKEGDHD